MKGKILAPYLISGEDGQRYEFALGEIKNFQGESLDSLVGCEVDFEVKENAAKNIFITQRAEFNFATFIKGDSLRVIKSLAFAYIACVFLGVLIPYLEYISSVVAPIFLFVMFFKLKKRTGYTFALKYLIFVICLFISIVLVFAAYEESGFLHVLLRIMAFAVMGVSFAFLGFYYDSLALATGQKLFKWLTLCQILLIIVALYDNISIFIPVFILAFGLELIAWIKVDRLNERAKGI